MPSSIEYVPGGLSKPRVTVNTAKVEPARLSAAAEEFVLAGSTASQEPRAATPPRAVVADESGEAEGVPAVLDVVAVAPKGVWGLGGGLTAPERLRLAEEEERERLREEEENRLALEAAKEEEIKSQGDGGLVRVHEWGVEGQDLDRLSDNATHAQDASSRSAFGGIPVGGVEEMQLGFEVVHSAALRGRSMSDVHRGGDDEGWQRARSRQRSLSPRMRFYGDDDGEVPQLLWAPAPYTNSPLYQGFGFDVQMSGIEAAELRSPLGAQDTCGAVQDSWFSGASASSDTDAGCTPASLAGDSMWAEEATGKHRVSQPSVTKPMAGVGSGDGGFVEGGGAEQFREFNCKVTVDDFEILHMIGEGGFGKVYQVRQRNRLDPACKTGRVLAMKCMRKDAVLADNLKGTKNERSILSRLRHPFIVTMHFAFQCKGRLYLIMDYFPGGQFLDMLHKNSPFSDEAVKVYSGEIFLALKELHANGIVHRDLKPENILVDAAGHLVVTDFGCSKIDDNSDGPVRSKSWAGTELYMAPEQLAGKEYGREVDWWALGVLVWEMVTGDHPFYHKNRKQIHNNILKKKLNLPSYHPQATHTFVKGLLARDAAKRLGSIRGAVEIEEHGFFRGFDFVALLRKDLPAPMRSLAQTDSELDVSAHSKRYTSAAACLSPLLSPMLSTSQHEAFAGFSFYGDGWGKPDLTSTPFRTTADQMWSEDMELLPSLSLPEPALAGGRPHMVGGTAGGTGSASSTPPGALAASSAPTTPLAPVRELSDLNLNEMASAAEAEAFSAAARLSMPTPVAPPGLGTRA